MRRPITTHTSQPWQIHSLTHDFRLEDVWALPTPGGPNDFHILVKGIASADPAKSLPHVAGALWKSAGDSASCSAGMRTTPGSTRGPPASGTGFQSICAMLRRGPLSRHSPSPRCTCSRTSGQLRWPTTVHGVVHLGWVAKGTGGYRGQMAVYVKPNGTLGSACMGSDQAISVPDHVPPDAAGDRAEMAGAMTSPKMTLVRTLTSRSLAAARISGHRGPPRQLRQRAADPQQEGPARFARPAARHRPHGHRAARPALRPSRRRPAPSRAAAGHRGSCRHGGRRRSGRRRGREAPLAELAREGNG